MAKGEFDMLYLCAGEGGVMIFSIGKSTTCTNEMVIFQDVNL